MFYFTIRKRTLRSAMRPKPSDIVRIIVTSNGVRAVTFEEIMRTKPDYAIDLLRRALEQREIDLKYEAESTSGLDQLWEWIYGETDRKGKTGPIPIRRRQAIKALVLREFLDLPWAEILLRLGLKNHEQKSL